MTKRKIILILGIFDHHSQGSRGIGLFNMERRQKQLYGFGLHIDSSQNEGIKVSFRAMK
ncbi:hypothetical protein ACT8ZS_13345 [Paenibacillus sp. M.A.Huq-84]